MGASQTFRRLLKGARARMDRVMTTSRPSSKRKLWLDTLFRLATLITRPAGSGVRQDRERS